MSKPVLIVTNKNDTHADFVAMEIREMGGDIIRLHPDDAALNSDFFLEKSNPGFEWNLNWLIKDSEQKIHKDSFDTIWYRKPKPVEANHCVEEDHAKLFIQEEYDYFWRSFYNLYAHKRWINPYWNNKQASQKLPNLELAESLGLKIPKTLVTNNYDKAREFGEICKWNLLVKTFFFSGFVVNQTEAWHCFAKRVTEADFNEFSATITMAPILFQEYIDKSIELRVTIIGDEVFTAALHSQEQEITQEDWRAMDSYKIKHTVYDLPVEICEALKAFNRHYSLLFSNFDLILTPDGEYYFLECNPNGQWYWIERLTEMPMAKAMAKLLLNV